MEYAKNCLEIGEKSKDEAKKLWPRPGPQLLGEMAKIPSPYQQDAIKLRRQLNPNASAEEGFEDAVIDGDAAVEKKKWAEAIEFYEKAIAAETAKTDKARLAAVKNTLVGCYHNLAMQLYQKGKVEEAIAMAKKALKEEFLQTKAAPGVAVFLLNVQYYQYLGAAEGTDEEKKAKGELLAKVAKTAKAILKIKEWAAKEEGDAARIVLLRLALAQDNMAEADKILSEINPDSKEYPKALTVMGFAHWFKYKTAKKQIEADEAKKAASRQGSSPSATKTASRPWTTPRRRSRPSIRSARGDAAMPETLRESQLLLAEIYKEGKDFKRAAGALQTLDRRHPQGLQQAVRRNALRIFNGAGQAYLQLGDVENITAVGGQAHGAGARPGTGQPRAS